MSKYLYKYIGTYRVMAEIDKHTNDFPRDARGEIDSSFDDFYIKCAHGVKIMHYGQSTLMCYIPRVGQGYNLLRTLCRHYCNIDTKNWHEAADKLTEQKYISRVFILENEMQFNFHANLLPYIATQVHACTNGSSISPLSPKNLPKTKYKIPETDLLAYKEAIGEFTKDNHEKLQKLNVANRKFEAILQKKKGADYWQEQRQLCLDKKSYIHHCGLWNIYITFLLKEGIK